MAELKIRTCRGPRNIKPDGSMANYRAVCGSTNVKVVQPSPTWITFYCYTCHWTNIEVAERPDQLQYEYDQLLGNANNTFGALGMEAPEDMPDEVRSMFVKEEV